MRSAVRLLCWCSLAKLSLQDKSRFESFYMPLRKGWLDRQSARMSILLVLRGQAFRAGCSEQKAVLLAYSRMFAAPLVEREHRVDLLVAAAGGDQCGTQALGKEVGLSAHNFTHSDVYDFQGKNETRNQGAAMLAAVKVVEPLMVGAAYTAVVYSRIDLRLQLSVENWGCNFAETISGASMLEAKSEWFGGINDVMIVVPQRHHRRFVTAVAAAASNGCERGCFYNSDCSQDACRPMAFSGHACLPVLRDAQPPPGTQPFAPWVEPLGQCFPQPQHNVQSTSGYVLSRTHRSDYKQKAAQQGGGGASTPVCRNGSGGGSRQRLA